MKRNIALVALALFVAFAGLMAAEYKQESKQFKNADAFTTAVNMERFSKSLPELIESQYLNGIATNKCNDMVKRHYTAHQDPDGKYIWDYTTHGFKYGENLAGGFYDSYDTMAHWVASPEHERNITDPMFKEVGHATCYNGKEYLNVEVFKS